MSTHNIEVMRYRTSEWVPAPEQPAEDALIGQLAEHCKKLRKEIKELKEEFAQLTAEIKEKRYLNFYLKGKLTDYYEELMEKREEELRQTVRHLQSLGCFVVI